MTYKGIARGDANYRHFTFTDDDTILKNGITYYKVNYGKDKLEGPDAEDEIGYFKYEDIIFLGGNRPKQANVETPKKESTEPKVETKVVKKSPGRPKKVKEERPKTEEVVPTPEPTQYVFGLESELFEYKVCEFHSKNIDDLQNELNEYGNEGWELCGFDTNKSLFSEMNIITIMKRKRIEH